MCIYVLLETGLVCGHNVYHNVSHTYYLSPIQLNYLKHWVLVEVRQHRHGNCPPLLWMDLLGQLVR